ncbi:MAG: arylesterase, partial [Candidatus Moranbacteria bacterium]|nr:arylesterase [Candidatus Moranbacteria bacterium]
AEKPKMAIILLGGNDFLKKIPREETFVNLEKIVSAFQGQGAITVVLGVRSGIISGGADAEYEALAKRTGSVYMSDVLAGLFGRSELMSDALHPNDQGYTKIAERLVTVLSEYLR